MYDITGNSVIAIDASSLAGVLPDSRVDPLMLLLPMVIALVISMMLIPVMVRVAPYLGLIDQPDSRKVHAHPIPRVGGFGIFFGAMVPIVMLLPVDQTLASLLAGSLILFVSGVLDDSMELGHYAKFVGQFLAVITVVYWGEVYVTQLPFLQGEAIGDTAGKLFTVFAMVGMINAINHSDGLDGLAGGVAMLSLCCIAWLAFLSGGVSVAMISLSLVGGLMGFMRYNTHPAIIFMGDSGSQFLGYMLGFLAVTLTQQVNPSLSPALPALILGLPIADIMAVFAQRMYRKMNWFKATRNHIHHRLLDLGFFHHESVVIIYMVQSVLVVAAALMPYEADGVILGLYLAIVAAVFLLLVAAERKGWQVNRKLSSTAGLGISELARIGKHLTTFSYWMLAAGLSIFLVLGSVLATDVPPGLTQAAMVLFGLMLVRLFVIGTARFMPLRVLCYISIAVVVYLVNINQPENLAGIDLATYVFFALMILGVSMVIRFSGRGDFNLTPTDFLVVVAGLSLAILSRRGVVDSEITAITLKTIILFYACEVVLNWMRNRWNLFTIATLISLAVISIRGMGLLGIKL